MRYLHVRAIHLLLEFDPLSSVRIKNNFNILYGFFKIISNNMYTSVVKCKNEKSYIFPQFLCRYTNGTNFEQRKYPKI